MHTDIVRRIRFVGNGSLFSGHNNLQLRTAMEQKQSPPLTFTFPFMYFNPPRTLNPDALGADSERLELWYAHHGWFDATVNGWEVRRARAASEKRAGVVDLLGHVDPGAPSFFREVTLAGVERGAAAATLARAALQGSDLQPDLVARSEIQFDLGLVQQAQDEILLRLGDHGYAHARVTPAMDAFPEENAVDVAFQVEPGPVVTYGEIVFDSELPHVERDLVLDSLTFRYVDPARPGVKGDQYRLTDLRESQQRLFDTGLFSLVDLRPDTSDPTAKVVPIHLNLREAKFRTFRLSGGLQYDYFLLTPRVTAEYRDLRLGGSKLQLRSAAGIGAVIGLSQQDDTAGTPWFLTGNGALDFDYPWFLRRKLTVSAGAYGKRDLQFGSLPYWTVGGQFSTRYFFTPDIQLGFGPKFEYFEYTGLTPDQLGVALTQFGPDFTSTTYRLLSFDVSFVVDWRDDPLDPRRGSYGAIDLRQSIPVPNFDGSELQTGFLYTRVDADLRGWLPFRVSKKERRLPFVLAGRAHGRLLIPWRGEDDALPYPDLAFLGGPNSLRGFRSNMVGPYDTACTYTGARPVPSHNNGEPYQVTRAYLPRGGALALEGAAELRYEWKYGLSFAVFGDVGALAGRPSDLVGPSRDVAADVLRYGGGVGLRYASPIGPIRIDLGLRPLFAEDLTGPGQSFGCNARDVLPRGFDLVTSSVRARERLLDQGGREFPLGINLFLAIGEAF